MCGVPFHAADGYIAKLVQKGYKVAICEQLSAPEQGKLVDRDVVRVVTPGTVIEENSGDNGSSALTASPKYPNSEPVRTIEDFAVNEDRYIDLNMIDPKEAGILRPELQKDCNRNMDELKAIANRK